MRTMPRPEIDLLREQRSSDSRSPFSFKLGRNMLIGACIALTALIIIIAPALIKFNGTISIASAGVNFIKQIVRLVTSRDVPLRGEDQDRINILLLGIGGAGHDGEYLSDTIIVASIKPSTKQVALISVPRDLWVTVPGYGLRKVNVAYAFGRTNNPPMGGLELARQTISRVTGQSINYVAEIDFSGFEKIIDVLGGVDITVDKSFVDTAYPTNDFGVQTVSFEKGAQHFDGARALIYVRSRHGTNGEGSDFARSKRQQKVLVAVKEKLLRTGVLLNPGKIGQLLDLLAKNTETDLSFSDVARLAFIARGVDTSAIISKTIDEASGIVQAATTEDGAFILRPRLGFNDFSEIKQLADQIFSGTGTSTNRAAITASGASQKSTSSNGAGNGAGESSPPQIPTPSTPPTPLVSHKVGVVVQNGTFINGLGRRMADMVAAAGNYNVVSISNADKRDFENTVLYNLTTGGRDEELAQLAKKVRATIAPTPRALTKQFAKDADFLIIVGTNNDIAQ